MCDSATSSKISDACADFVNKNMLFTAFDVTKKVWELLGNTSSDRWPKGYHSSIKNDIHRAMRPYVDNGTYEKVMWDIGNGIVAALYFPTGADPSTYVAGTTTVAPVTPVVATTDDDDDDDDDYNTSAATATNQLATSGKITPDVHGQLHVPCEFLRKAGFSPKDIAYAIQKGDKLSLVKHAGQPPVAAYHVDYHGAVRLSRKTVTTVWPTASNFSFDATADEVIVSQG